MANPMVIAAHRRHERMMAPYRRPRALSRSSSSSSSSSLLSPLPPKPAPPRLVVTVFVAAEEEDAGTKYEVVGTNMAGVEVLRLRVETGEEHTLSHVRALVSSGVGREGVSAQLATPDGTLLKPDEDGRSIHEAFAAAFGSGSADGFTRDINARGHSQHGKQCACNCCIS
mmetsp:Transcript_25419/g.73322  ORF Transcript_25419/g.73322 Transcript_25419/m.73322 type:complete len:170 (+) Transcript_25419:80-589(+)